ncbi:Periodic tryptophan protein 1 homolog [Linum perenne]
MIPTLSWLTKGVAKSIPAVAEPLSREEIEELLKSGSLQAGGESRSEAEDDGNMYVDQLAELDMENYDNEDEVVEIFSSGLGDVYYPSNDLDPYLRDNDDVDSEEEEDLAIKANDAVIVCARNEDELSHLEVWICEVSDDGDLNMYIHHQVNLSAFPLCVAWLDCPLKGGEKGNFIAVGSMEPAIEIWDLDIVQAVAWNHHEAQILLSGSFDRSVIMKDGRNPTSRGIRWSVAADVESLAWDPHSSHSFVVSVSLFPVLNFHANL